MLTSAKLIVIASIHQPSTSTFELFDKLLLLSQGQVCYNGSISLIKPYLEARGNPMPLYVNPAEFLLDWTSSDFAGGDDALQEKLNKIHAEWKVSDEASMLIAAIPEEPEDKDRSPLLSASGKHATSLQIVAALIYRSFIKSYRDVVAYGIRFAMYTGLAVMMGTVWLRLPPTVRISSPLLLLSCCFRALKQVSRAIYSRDMSYSLTLFREWKC